VTALTLTDILARASALPTLPEVAQYIITTIDDETANAENLVEHLNTDPAVVARVLASANSGAFGLANHIDSTRQLILGLEKIRSITLATAVVDRINPASQAFNPRVLWRHSLGVAMCARAIAEAIDFNAEAAFTAGLLHDIGQLLLFAVTPDLFGEVLTRRQNLDECIVDAEHAVFDFDHAQAGGELARLWKLPAAIADGINGHHNPESGEFGEMGDLIHLAEVLSHALDLGELPNNKVPELSVAACARLGIDWQVFARRFVEIEARYDELTLALGLR
jgi:putative nucleotidyltransferase with HDIG domain